jgi:hypothetical protein
MKLLFTVLSFHQNRSPCDIVNSPLVKAPLRLRQLWRPRRRMKRKLPNFVSNTGIARHRDPQNWARPSLLPHLTWSVAFHPFKVFLCNVSGPFAHEVQWDLWMSATRHNSSCLSRTCKYVLIFTWRTTISILSTLYLFRHFAFYAMIPYIF